MSALMKGMGSAASATTTALNSSGSAARENAIYLKPLEGRLGLLKTEWQAVASTVINSDWIASIITGATKFVSILGAGNGLIGKLALITTGILAAKGAAAQLKATAGVNCA